MCHNRIRDLTAKLLTKRTANIAEGVRLDIAASGFWEERRKRMFVDVRVFNPLAPSNRQTILDKRFLKHQKKRRVYEQ